MNLLESMNSAADVKNVPPCQLPELAAEVRSAIVSGVSKTGGHLASSLGAVELAIGLLRVFNPPCDRVVWDVGHQAYAWKILTGRRDAFSTIRTLGGLSGFPNPDENECDAFVAGHAGVALAVAEGMAAADVVKGERAKRCAVAVVGDASMTNGETLEALNNVAQLHDLGGKVILVLNDNKMSISKNVGGFARFLGRMLTGVRYNRVKAAAEAAGHKLKLSFLRGPYHRLEQMIKSIWLGNSFFENFGLRYIGPVDGHDTAAVERALTVAREYKRSVVVHICTVKGKGFAAAERKPSAWHGVGKFDPATAATPAAKHDWSECFGSCLEGMAEKDDRICAITAAMRTGTGLENFSLRFPSRFFDSGICESHAITFAAGLAKSGMRPFVAMYSTFLQRAIDQVMHDICLLKLPVVIGIDRAGVVGQDGRTHQGVFDIPMLKALPGLAIMQPASEGELSEMMSLALDHGGPAAIRYPRGVPPAGAVSHSKVAWGRADELCGRGAKIQIWAIGDMVPPALETAKLISAKGLDCGVVNARFVKPFDSALIGAQVENGVEMVVTMENGSLAGGFGESLIAALARTNVKTVAFGWPDEFIHHGSQAELFAEAGLTPGKMAPVILSNFIKET